MVKWNILISVLVLSDCHWHNWCQLHTARHWHPGGLLRSVPLLVFLGRCCAFVCMTCEHEWTLHLHSIESSGTPQLRQPPTTTTKTSPEWSSESGGLLAKGSLSWQREWKGFQKSSLKEMLSNVRGSTVRSVHDGCVASRNIMILSKIVALSEYVTDFSNALNSSV